MPPDLAAFITERLDETEAMARAACEPDVAGNGDWTAYPHPPGRRDGRQDRPVQLVGAGPDEKSWTVCEVGQWDRAPMVAAHIAANDPARALRSITATRAILTDCTAMLRYPANKPAYNLAMRTLRNLAAEWADHPGWNPAWAPLTAPQPAETP